jgi:hypothetical protein
MYNKLRIAKVNMRYVYYIALIIVIATLVKFLQLDKNENILNIIGRAYFDEEYYLANYPEVKNQTISPFKHYTKYGWLEDKNPSNEFNTRFYKNLYLINDNKYNLNPLADYVRSKASLKIRFTNSNQLKKAEPLKNPKYYLTLVAIF